MNLDELRTVRRTERQKDTLQHLRESFYRDVAEYIQSLKNERDSAAAAADNPFSNPEVGRLTDEIETAEEIVESIYERRVGKVVKLASFTAADMPADDEGLTAEEQTLYDALVSRIKENRDTVLDTLAGESVSDEAVTGDDTDSSQAESATGDAESDLLADAMGTTATQADDNSVTPVDPAPPDAPPSTTDSDLRDEPIGRTDGEDDRPPKRTADAESDAGHEPLARDTERTTVRITRDVGEILGIDDREYDLASEDVVTLPTTNAEPLLESDAAERLD